VYDGLDLLAELDGGGNLVAAYTHGPGIDDPLIVRYNGVNYVLHKNHQGSVTEITNMSRVTVKTYTYDAYGNILSQTGPELTGGFTCTARQYHSRSGLYYYRARFYDPTLGRFITQDPIGLARGINLYAYVGSDPVNWYDPLGLTEVTIEVDRREYHDNYVIGRIYVDYYPIGYSLELPPINNKPFDSSIPPGEYPASIFESPKFNKKPVVLLDVPGRDMIEIHPGNFPEDTQGCILPGKELGQSGVLKSRDAMNEILDRIGTQMFLDSLLGEQTTIKVIIKP
jgi:RHS repeat-associated protein